MRHSLIALVVLLLALSAVLPAQAQATDTPTPEPTGTPIYSSEVELSSGRLMTVERSWTLGEAAQFLAIVALVIVEVALVVTGYAARWNR